MKATWAVLALLLSGAGYGGAVAQETAKTYRIAYLGSGSPATSGPYAEGFRETLSKLGFVDGQNTQITYRWAGGKFDRISTLVDELLREKPDVIVGFGGTQIASAIKSATSRKSGTTQRFVGAVAAGPY
jgi:putative ABC transport system substrate-binding protein